MKKLITILMISLFFGFASKAQLKIGAPAGAPNASAILDLNAGAANRGLLFPSVTLTSTTLSSPLAAHVAGMVVYNTATINDVTPGFYFSDGGKWASFTTSNTFPAATYSAASLNCTGTLSGTYQTGVVMTSGNTKQVTIAVASAGTYSASTNAQNGVTFAAAGTSSAAASTNTITLTASGTPAASGAFTYTLTLAGQTCTFSVTFAVAATFACGSATQTQTPAGTLTNSTAYTGNYNVTYTSGNGSAYGTATQTINGLTLTRTAGTLSSGGGTVAYNLSGTYTGATSSTVTFTIPECTSATYGDAILTSIQSGGNSTDIANYQSATTNQVINISLTSYQKIEAISGAVAVLNSDAFMLTNPINGGLSNANFTSSTPASLFAGTYFTAGQYMVAFQLKNKGFGSGANDQGGIIKFASAATGPYTDYCGALPNVPLTTNYTSRYYVIKAPSNQIPATPTMAVYSSATMLGDQVGAGSTGPYPVNTGTGNNNTLSSSGSIYNSLYIQAIQIPTKKW